MEKCDNKARSNFYKLESTKKEEKKNLLVLPYNKNLNYIKPLLRINLVFTFPSTIKNILVKNSSCNKKPCIYNIPCKNCGGFYIGQTSKTLSTRISQHKMCVRTGNESSAIFKHHQEFDHPVTWENAHELYFISNFIKRNLLESIIIKSTFENNINMTYGLYYSDKIIEYFAENIINTRKPYVKYSII